MAFDREWSMGRSGVRRAAIVAAAVLALCAGRAQAETKPLEVIAFGGAPNWPLWIAEEQGIFKKNDVAINFTQAAGSVPLFQGLVTGKYDIAITAIDNSIAYMEGQGEVELPAKPDLIAVMGGMAGALQVFALPEIKSYADLKGKPIGVDAKTTGFAFVTIKMIENGGLKPDDYSLESVGGTPFRAKALDEKKVAATLLYSPFDLPLRAKGYNLLGSVGQIGNYQAFVGTVQRQWAKDNSERLVGFIRSWVQAVDFLYDPKNKEVALANAMKNAKVDRAGAENVYATLLGEKEGLQRKGKIDVDGIRTVLKLRSELGTPKKDLSAVDPAKYVDETWYKQAIAAN
jgi:ABC-type nitrate/sulfonate/bicarbonate transport system substrate-binding protein